MAEQVREPGGATRVVIAGLNYAPERVGVGKYTGEMAVWLAARGNQVHVACAPPYYPDWKVQPPYRAWRRCRETLAGVDVIRCPLWVPQSPTALRRVIHLLSFALGLLSGLLGLRRVRPQWVIAIVPTLFSAPVALLAARLWGARTWVHIQDFELGAASGLQMGMLARFMRIGSFLEGWLLRRFDRVSTISLEMDERLEDYGIPPGRRYLLPNWVDVEHVRPEVDARGVRTQLGLTVDDVVMLYSGSLSVKQDLELVFEAARVALSANPRLHLVICGDGPRKEQLQQLARGLPRLQWYPSQSFEDFPAWLTAADIHLLPQKIGAAAQVMPSKLGGMMASGRAVIATAMPQTALGETVEQCGVVTPPGDAEALAAAMLALAADAPKRQALGLQGRQLALQTLAQDAILERFQRELSRP